MIAWSLRLLLAGLALATLLAAGGCEHGQRFLLPLVVGDDPAHVYRLPPNGDRVVYLTIDDGPSVHTDDILELLDDYGATATFFIHTDYIQDPAILDRITAGGHNLGHHMPTDRDWSEDSAEDFQNGFVASHCLLAAYGDDYAGWFRPPQGTVNPETVPPALALAKMDGEGSYMMASFIPWDAGGLTELSWERGATILARRYGGGIGGAARPGDIVLFHDGPRLQRTQNTLVSLKLFLAEAEKRGLEPRALPNRTWSSEICSSRQHSP